MIYASFTPYYIAVNLIMNDMVMDKRCRVSPTKFEYVLGSTKFVLLFPGPDNADGMILKAKDWEVVLLPPYHIQTVVGDSSKFESDMVMAKMFLSDE